MNHLLHDVRYAIRAGLRQPMTTLAIVLTFALGIGVTTAIVSIANATLLRPLPYAGSDRLVILWGNFLKLKIERLAARPAEFVDYRDRTDALAEAAAFRAEEFSLAGEREPEQIDGTLVTPNLLRMLGAQTVKGRIFTDDEGQAGREKVAILSSGLWQRRFGRDPDLVGRKITLSGESYEVVGIVEPDFQFPHRSLQFSEPADLWVPLVLSEEQVTNWSGRWELNVIARLKDKATIEEARSQLTQTALRFEESSRGYRGPGGIDAGWRITVVPLSEEASGRIRRSLYVLLAIAGLVLVLACVNVSNLLLARSTARSREMAVRSALGASRRRLLAQILTESVSLSMIGGILGLFIAVWTISLALAIGAKQIPRLDEANIDWAVFGFALAMSVVAGLVCGLICGLRLSIDPSQEFLRDAGSSVGTKRRRLSDGLVVIEIAVAFCVIVSAVLLLRSMRQLEHSDSGLVSRGVLGVEIALPANRYASPVQIDDFYNRLHDQLSALPGVESVGISSVFPLTGAAPEDPFSIEGRPLDLNRMTTAGRQAVSRGFFRTLSIPIARGREFEESDRGRSPGVAVINEAMAEQFWPGADPIGQRIKLGAPRSPSPWLTIVGIAKDIPHRRLGSSAQPDWYYPISQRPQSRMYAFLRGPGEILQLAPSIRQAVASVDREQPVSEFKLLDEAISESLTSWRFSSMIAAFFGILALLLSIGGVYSTTSYLTSQRTREFGIRMALGARSAELTRMVIRRGLVLLAFGTVLGMAGALILSRSMKALLFGIAPTDPLSYLAAAAILGAVTIFSVFLPAFRAGRLDPAVTLRCE